MKKVLYVMRKYPALTCATQNLKNGAIKLPSQIHALLRGVLDWHLEKLTFLSQISMAPSIAQIFIGRTKIH